ncbi:hypothetical protein PF004_g24156 [Phytophthora fragariae]|nr:hypothetical protein PF004_g24156 [Phytophthora fragariae]
MGDVVAAEAPATSTKAMEVAVGGGEKDVRGQHRCTGVARRIEGFVDPARLTGCCNASRLARRAAKLSRRRPGHGWSEEALELFRQAARRGEWRVLRRLSVQVDWAVPSVGVLWPDRRDLVGCKALHVAVWWGRPLFILQWLVDEGTNVNERDTCGRTALHYAAIGGHLSFVQLLVDKGAQVDERGWSRTALHYAALKGHLSVVQWLVDRGAQVDEKCWVGRTALHLAAEGGHLSVVQSLVDKGALVDDKDVHSKSPLHLAARGGHLSVVQWLVDKGAKVDGRVYRVVTALHHAAEGGHLSVVKWLVDKGAQMDGKGVHNKTPLHLAAEGGHLSVVQWLVDKGARVDGKDYSGVTALHYAAKGGHLSVVQWLVNKGARVTGKDDEGATALHFAARGGHVCVMQCLVGNGAQIDEKACRAETPLHMAAGGGHLSVVQWLVDKGAQVHEKAWRDETALHLAAEGGHLSVVQWLVDKGAEVNTKRLGGITALHLAAEGGYLSVVRWLVNKGARVDGKERHEQTPLHFAARGGHISVVQLLVENRACFFLADDQGNTALHYALINRNWNTVKFLLSSYYNSSHAQQTDLFAALFAAAKTDRDDVIQLLHGYEVDLQHTNAQGRTALLEAAACGAINCVNLLLDRAADVHRADHLGTTPAIEAVRGGHVDVLLRLLGAGASVSDCNRVGRSALHYAAESAHSDAMDMLLTNGADVNCCDKRGWTPLHCAAAAGHEQIVVLLIKKDGEMNVETIAGKTALVLAVERGHADVMEFLMNYGASIPEGLPLIVDGDTHLVSGAESAASSKFLNEAEWLLDPSDVQFDVESDEKTVEGTWLDTPIEVKKRSKREKTKNFVEELHRWSNLNHPHVVKLFGACYAGEPFFVYERAVNGSLREYRKRPENKPKLWDKLYEAALGLQYLHDRNIVHGALCCQSIVVAANAVAKLRNFGGDADDIVYRSYLEDSEAIPYRVDWTAPEVLSGFPHSFESDVFAFGMCIVEAIKDSAPWGVISGGSAAIIEAIRTGKLPVKPDEMSTSQWNLVERVCCYNARDRLTSSDVVRELEVFTLEYELGQHESSNCGDCDRGPISWTELGDVQVLISNLCDSLDASTKSTCFQAPTAISDVLDELDAMCADNSTIDRMNRDVYERVRDVFNQLIARNDAPTAELTQKFTGIVQDFHGRVTNTGGVGTARAAQFAASRQVADNIFSVHGSIDMFMDAAGLSKSAEAHNWRDRWGSRRKKQQHEFMTKLQNLPDLLGDVAVGKAREEVLTYVRFELSKYPTSYATSIPADLMQAKSALSTMKNASWFIPEYEVVFDQYNAFSRGSFGSVHHGKWRSSKVVVKKVKLESEDDEVAFHNEVTIWHKLYHPHVVQLFGACHIGQPFFVCEFAALGQLDKYLRRHPEEVWQKLYEAVLGLRYVHVKGVVHGDLKCNNILVGGDHCAKLTDFGLSSLELRASTSGKGPNSDVELASGETAKPLIGAIRWKAPEVLKGEKATFASDIYSFGMCIIEAATGEYPWGMRLDDNVVRYRVVELRELPTRREELVDAAWHLVEHMCRYEPSDRLGIPAVIGKLEALSMSHAV